MYSIIEELNLENGSNYKMDVLRKHQDNELLKKILKMTYDKVAYSFGISMKNVYAGSSENMITLEEGLNELEKLARREVTGNNAIDLLENTLECVSENDRLIIEYQ
jgi:type II secretory pathway component HofQ